MKYYLVSKSKNGGLALMVFEARNTREALLYVVDAWSNYTKGDDYQKCKSKSIKEIGEHLANMNTFDRVVDLALFKAIDPCRAEFKRNSFDRPVWSIFDYADADTIF